MKVLTVRQPWAGLIARGIKDVENRSWAPSALDIGDRFAIHASTRFDTAHGLDGYDLDDELCHVRSVIVCTVRLADVTTDAHLAGYRWAVAGAIHWHLDRVHVLPARERVFRRGQTGLWTA